MSSTHVEQQNTKTHMSTNETEYYKTYGEK